MSKIKEMSMAAGRAVYARWVRVRGLRMRLEIALAMAAIAFAAGAWVAY